MTLDLAAARSKSVKGFRVRKHTYTVEISFKIGWLEKENLREVCKSVHEL